jgi:tRNA wybutosine-synthesizing protein 2
VARTELRSKWAVDLYAGIGYFTFSYVKLGLRVLCWELNPWSVEGLRRGAEANGWTVQVIRGHDLTRATARDLVESAAQIILFEENNTEAGTRISELRRACADEGKDESGTGAGAIDILHVNCGLLPTSEASWQCAWGIVRPRPVAWLHLHENVGATHIAERRGQIERWFESRGRKGAGQPNARVDHVEMVKTFAPGVWHCVFDLYIHYMSTDDIT